MFAFEQIDPHSRPFLRGIQLLRVVPTLNLVCNYIVLNVFIQFRLRVSKAILLSQQLTLSSFAFLMPQGTQLQFQKALFQML